MGGLELATDLSARRRGRHPHADQAVIVNSLIPAQHPST
jgi:hypothetical protein